MIYGHPEVVEVRREDDGQLAFYVGTREGWERIGPEINMLAKYYEEGTVFKLFEPLPIEQD